MLSGESPEPRPPESGPTVALSLIRVHYNGVDILWWPRRLVGTSVRPPRRHVSHRRHRAWRTRPGRQTGGPLTPLAPVPFLSSGPGGSRPGERRHSARNCRYPGRSPRARCLVRAVTAPRTGTGPADRLARPAGSLLAPSTLSLLAVAPALSAVRYRVPRRNVRGHPLVSLPGIPGCLVRGIRPGSAHATRRLNWVSHRNQLSGLFDPDHRPELLTSCPRNTGGSEPCLGQHLLGPLALRRVVAVNPGPPGRTSTLPVTRARSFVDISKRPRS